MAARNRLAAVIKHYKSNTYKRAALSLALALVAMRTKENNGERVALAESKVYSDAASALKGLTFDGMTVMSGGFGLSGNPENLITALKEDGARNITVIANNCGADGLGLWVLLNNGQIKKMISSYVGENKLFEELYLTGKLELELNPQGTLAERIRAGGAGIPAFYTRTGVGTVVADGKPTEVFDGLTYVRERWLRADLAMVKAWKGDTEGNLVYRKTARNFNPMMATAGKVTIAEVEELVEPGQLDPDKIHTPGIFVQRILQGRDYKKPIERVTTRPRPGAA
jgi:3-oxoacid CoA-transferase subunit A